MPFEMISELDSLTEAQVGCFVASDGYGLHYRHWRPEREKPSGYVVALHGIQSHSGWYGMSSLRLAEAGYDIRFLDRRGAGMNSDPRGHVEHLDRLVNDVVQFLSEVRHERNRTAPAAPLILLGVSWGGKLAAVTAGRRPELVDGLALLYPGIFARIRPRWYHKLALKWEVATGGGRKQVPLPLGDPEMFTSQPKWQRFIRDDSLALHEATVSFLNASVQLDREAASIPSRLRCPLLMMLAGKDRIIDNDASRRYFDQTASSQRTLIEYPNAQHTLEFEPDRETFLGDLLHWLEAIRETC